jgi:hypothetical protein
MSAPTNNWRQIRTEHSFYVKIVTDMCDSYAFYIPSVCILYAIRMYFICHPYVFYMPSACIIYTIRMYFICHPYVFYMPSACVSTFICHPYAFHMPSLSIIYAILVYYAKLPSFRILSDYQREEGSDPINQLKIRLIFVLLLIMN